MKLLRTMTILAVLFAAPAARANGFFAITTGDADETPAVLQTKLKALGYDCAIDGVVGPQTRDALRSFQAQSELEVTGSFDAATQEKLEGMVHALALVRGAGTPASVPEIVEVEGDEYAVDALFAAASVDSERSRLEAVALLADMRTTRSRATLGIVMHGNTLASVRIAAARELARYGDEQSLFAIALASESERDSLVASVMQDTLDGAITAEVAPTRVELVSDAR